MMLPVASDSDGNMRSRNLQLTTAIAKPSPTPEAACTGQTCQPVDKRKSPPGVDTENLRRSASVNPLKSNRLGVTPRRGVLPVAARSEAVVAQETWFTPGEVAASRRLRLAKVLNWIHRGELEAINCADNPSGRPRWRISIHALEAFDRARSSRLVALPVSRQRARCLQSVEVVEFF